VETVDIELPEKRGVLLEMYDERSFSQDALRKLPELATELKAEESLLHVQMGILSHVVQEEITENNLELTPRIFAFLEEALAHPRAISEIANAIAISFVELDVMQKTDAGRRAIETMPPNLKSVLMQERL
jgi:hypothetical protein